MDKNCLQYLNILGLRENKPTIEYLTQLCQRQLLHFPYESVSKMVYYHSHRLRLFTFEEYLQNQIDFGYGGTCYPQNYFFCQLLKGLGFIAKNVRTSVDGESDQHLNIRVYLQDKTYIIDFGFMDAFCGPFDEDGLIIEQTFGQRQFRFLPKGESGKFRFEIIANDKLHKYFDEDREIADISELDQVILDSFSFDAYFVKNLVIGRRSSDPCYSLWNKDLFEYEKGEVRKTTLKTLEEVQEVVHKKMNLPNYPNEILNKLFED